MQQSSATTDVSFDPLLGLIADNIGWVPSLRFLLRRNRLIKLLQQIQFNSILEIGCGSGSLLVEMAKKNVLVAQGLETSKEARVIANQIIDSANVNVQIHASPPDDWHEQYDVISAYEVLEHIEDDLAALTEWSNWVRPGGYVLISVPAHQKRWGYGDEWAGHYRRYNLNDIKALVNKAGLSIEHLECYGFPLANLTEKLGNNIYKKKIAARSVSEVVDKETATAGSGVKRDSYLKLFRWINNPIGKLCIRGAFCFQRIFYKTNLGSGYIVLARK